MIKAVIFDLDDTLISERQYTESGFFYVSKILSEELDRKKDEIYNLLIQLYTENPSFVFNRLYEKLNMPFDDESVQRLVTLFRNHSPSIELYDDVLPALIYLRSRNVMTGVITDGYLNAQQCKLQTIHAYALFDHIIITDEWGVRYRKPHPRAFQVMKKRMNIDYDEMAYVGDNPEKDFYIGWMYPITTIRIQRPHGIYSNRSYFNDIKEKYRIGSLYELCFLLA